MSVFNNISLQPCGHLVPSFPIGRGKYGEIFWACFCDCGSTCVVRLCGLVSGSIKSCGCRHGGGWRSPRTSGVVSLAYSSWRCVVQRCTNPKNKDWPQYGGANPPIQVCDRWLNSFEAFLEDRGERPAETSLGRFGDVGNYSCGHCEQCKQNGWELNCAWQTDAQQKLEAKIKRWNKQLQAA